MGKGSLISCAKHPKLIIITVIIMHTTLWRYRRYFNPFNNCITTILCYFRVRYTFHKYIPCNFCSYWYMCKKHMNDTVSKFMFNKVDQLGPLLLDCHCFVRAKESLFTLRMLMKVHMLLRICNTMYFPFGLYS